MRTQSPNPSPNPARNALNFKVHWRPRQVSHYHYKSYTYANSAGFNKSLFYGTFWPVSQPKPQPDMRVEVGQQQTILHCEPIIRAVLTRLREPTPGMNQAGAHAALIQREGHMGIFRAMIEAALEGK